MAPGSHRNQLGLPIPLQPHPQLNRTRAQITIGFKQNILTEMETKCKAAVLSQYRNLNHLQLKDWQADKINIMRSDPSSFRSLCCSNPAYFRALLTYDHRVDRPPTPPPPSKRGKSRHSFPPTRSLNEKEMGDLIHRTAVQITSQFDRSSSNVEAKYHFTSPTQSLRNTKKY
ncbi:hypothetical protein GEMRC1_012081 [Eukaryota sp. GEM-RC1]